MSLAGFLSPALMASVSIQVLCQMFKVVLYSIKNRKLGWHRLIHPAGMPSAHSAFVTALTVSVAIHRGVNSDFFALAFVFSIIIIYDSIRLRGAVQTHSRLLAKLLELLPEQSRQPVPQLIGHTPAELAVGVAVGGGWAVLFSQLF